VEEVTHKVSLSETIEDRVLRVVSRSRRIPLSSVQPECTFQELGIDSLDRLNILFDLESEFEIEIDNDQAKKAIRISDIIAGIKRLTERTEPASPRS
jgi:acyl carrier protein